MKGKIWTNLLAFVMALCLCFGLAACGENGGNGSQGDETSDPLVGVWTSEMQGAVMEISIAEQDGDLYFVMANKVGGITQGAMGGPVEKTDTGYTLNYSDNDDDALSYTLTNEALTVRFQTEDGEMPVAFAVSGKKKLSSTISVSGKRYYDEREYPYSDEESNWNIQVGGGSWSTQFGDIHNNDASSSEDEDEDMEPYTNTGRYIEIDFSTAEVSYYKISGRQGNGNSHWYHVPGSIVSYTGKAVKVGGYILILSANVEQSVIVYQENDTLQMVCPDFVWDGPVELTSTPNRERVKLTIRYQGNSTGEEVYMAVKGKKISELRIGLDALYEFDEADQETVLNEDTVITLTSSGHIVG